MCEIKYTKRGSFAVAGFILAIFAYFKVCSASKRKYGVNVLKMSHVWATVEVWLYCQFVLGWAYMSTKRELDQDPTHLIHLNRNTNKCVCILRSDCTSYKSLHTSADWGCATGWHAAFGDDGCCNIVNSNIENSDLR